MNGSLFPETVEEAKARIKAGASDGIDCPCCGELVMRYHRSIYHKQVVNLARLYERSKHLPPGAYVDIVNTMERAAGELSQLKHWGLVEAEELTPEQRQKLDRKSRGRWRITEKGKRFVLGQLSVRKKAMVLFDVVEWYDGPEVFAKDCLRKNFSLREIMGGDGSD